MGAAAPLVLPRSVPDVAAPASRPSRARAVLTNLGSFVLAAVLLGLSLRGVELAAITDALRTADYRYLPLLVVVLFASHAVRAWRWKLLLDGLPEGPRVTFGTSLGAVLVGYMVNYVAPRVGEVVRVGIVARRAKLPVSSVLGTVVLDRLLDVAMLAIALLTLPLTLGPRLAHLLAMTRNPLAGYEGWLIGLAVGVMIGAWMLWRTRRRLLGSPLGLRIAPLLRRFAEGLYTLRTAPRRGLLVVLTVAMWLLYGLLGYLPFLMLRLAEPYGLDLLDGWSVMLIGALGMVVPTPGGAGSYHVLVIEALTRIFGMPRDPASTYAVLSHGAQLVLYALAGVAALVGLSLSKPPEVPEEQALTPEDPKTGEAAASTVQDDR